jgi:leucine dehydrogenase
MTIFEEIDFADHEQVVFCSDDSAGLRAIIAIHNTRRGPSLGGCRMWGYASESEALNDVLRLSRGMTYKAVMAGIALGGGKSVIIGDPSRVKTPTLMQAMGQAVDRLSGRYIISEDVGTSVSDMAEIKKSTRYVVGLDPADGGAGDPSPTTARGCYVGLKAAVEQAFKTADLRGARVAVQGLGNVGWHLCQYVKEAGAELVVSDVRFPKVERAVAEFGAKAVTTEEIYGADVDVFAPCALGAILNDETIPRLKAKVIAGAANNQLARPHHADALTDRDILYAPDYIINAAGLIRVDSERRGFDPHWVNQKVDEIADTLKEVFTYAESHGVSTAAAAERLAKDRLDLAGTGH